MPVLLVSMLPCSMHWELRQNNFWMPLNVWNFLHGLLLCHKIYWWQYVQLIPTLHMNFMPCYLLHVHMVLFISCICIERLGWNRFWMQTFLLVLLFAFCVVWCIVIFMASTKYLVPGLCTSYLVWLVVLLHMDTVLLHAHAIGIWLGALGWIYWKGRRWMLVACSLKGKH